MSFKLMALPPEIRDLLYRQIFTNAKAQHVVLLPGGEYARYPCNPLSDDDFLQSSSDYYGESKWADYLNNTLRNSPWRDGHLGCDPGSFIHSGERLPSPTPLLLACRQIYQEAAVHVYKPLIFYDMDAFDAFLNRTQKSIPAGLKPVQLTVVSSPSREWFIPRELFLIEADAFECRLSTLDPSDLSGIRIRLIGTDCTDSEATFQAPMIGRRICSRVDRREMIVSSISDTGWLLQSWLAKRGCQICVYQDVTWMHVLYVLSHEGRDDTLRQLNSYARLMEVAGDLQSYRN
ncbi:uncharacterized protein PG998_014921 [Apiospora kogelbergensis]|uniref:uncharacterized protein n=1 Tax=Apiospora kogelbergensis TaxID=1337665 RepID=UPI00312F16D7